MIVLPICDSMFYTFQELNGLSLMYNVPLVEFLVYFPLVILVGYFYYLAFDKLSVKAVNYMYKKLFTVGIADAGYEFGIEIGVFFARCYNYCVNRGKELSDRPEEYELTQRFND